MPSSLPVLPARCRAAWISLVAAVVFLATPVRATAVEKQAGVFASASASTIWSHPELRGVLVRASWSSVEPEPWEERFHAASRAALKPSNTRGQELGKVFR